MATVTYVGGETAGPTTGTHWDGVQFPLNVPVTVDVAELVEKAKGHPHFTVSDDAPKGKKAKAAYVLPQASEGTEIASGTVELQA